MGSTFNIPDIGKPLEINTGLEKDLDKKVEIEEEEGSLSMGGEFAKADANDPALKMMENFLQDVPKEDVPLEVEDPSSSVDYVAQLNEYLEDELIDLSEDDIKEELESETFGFKEFMSSVRKGLEKKKLKEHTEKENAIVEAFKKELGGLSEITRKGIEFERYNQDDNSVADFYKTLVYKSDITSLNPESEKDAEKILKEWNKIQGLSADESDELISDLKESNKLTRQATILKPKLDTKAAEISKSKLEEQRIIEEQQEQLKSKLEEKVIGILNTGKVGSIPVDKQLATWLYRSVIQDEIPVVIKGKTVNLTGAEALIMYHKYDEKGSVERLMESLILLTDPEKFNSTYAKEVKLKETEKYVQDHKISAQRKVGREVSPESKNRLGLKLRD
ncbi:MAG TPA: hypothetical protein P5513_05100 [Candidatus Diapherotrites archaeon]|nr:hypothetical protein [Candidatus Diapherotrites archaeon]